MKTVHAEFERLLKRNVNAFGKTKCVDLADNTAFLEQLALVSRQFVHEFTRLESRPKNKITLSNCNQISVNQAKELPTLLGPEFCRCYDSITVSAKSQKTVRVEAITSWADSLSLVENEVPDTLFKFKEKL